MPLQNRVDPFGDLHAVEARGLFTGNRGTIHDPETRTLLKKRWTTKAWIICACAYKGLRREVMGRNAPSGGAGWTELFFLDEVTALAAGHRPCFLCRRAAAEHFLQCHREASGEADARAPDLDARLHAERLAGRGRMVELDHIGITRLPEGAIIFDGQSDYAIRGGKALRWSFDGYDEVRELADVGPGEMCLVTPRTTLAILEAGYRPVWHPSAVATAR